MLGVQLTAPLLHNNNVGTKTRHVLVVLINRSVDVTWQVDEGAPGRRAAVGDGEGHSVNLRCQVRDV